MKRLPWHKTFLESLAVLADLPLQARIWIDGDTSVYLESPTELYCQVFHDSALEEMLAAGRVFTDDIDSTLRTMKAIAERLNLEQAPKELIDDPDWVSLSELSRGAHFDIEQLLSAD